MLWSWHSFSKQIRIRSFKWGTVHLCSSRGCKNIKGQIWRLIKNLPVPPTLGTLGSSLAELVIFFATSNFDLKYFGSLLAYKNVQYLIWKIWVQWVHLFFQGCICKCRFRFLTVFWVLHGIFATGLRLAAFLADFFFVKLINLEGAICGRIVENNNS